MKCPACDGSGEQIIDYFEWGAEYQDCFACNGSGKQTLWWIISNWFWNTALGQWIVEREVEAEWKKNPPM